MHFEQRGTRKPPKNTQLKEVMILKDLMTALLTSELYDFHQGQD